MFPPLVLVADDHAFMREAMQVSNSLNKLIHHILLDAAHPIADASHLDVEARQNVRKRLAKGFLLSLGSFISKCTRAEAGTANADGQLTGTTTPHPTDIFSREGSAPAISNLSFRPSSTSELDKYIEMANLIQQQFYDNEELTFCFPENYLSVSRAMLKMGGVESNLKGEAEEPEISADGDDDVDSPNSYSSGSSEVVSCRGGHEFDIAQLSGPVTDIQHLVRKVVKPQPVLGPVGESVVEVIESVVSAGGSAVDTNGGHSDNGECSHQTDSDEATNDLTNSADGTSELGDSDGDRDGESIGDGSMFSSSVEDPVGCESENEMEGDFGDIGDGSGIGDDLSSNRHLPIQLKTAVNGETTNSKGTTNTPQNSPKGCVEIQPLERVSQPEACTPLFSNPKGARVSTGDSGDLGIPEALYSTNTSSKWVNGRYCGGQPTPGSPSIVNPTVAGWAAPASRRPVTPIRYKPAIYTSPNPSVRSSNSGVAGRDPIASSPIQRATDSQDSGSPPSSTAPNTYKMTSGYSSPNQGSPSSSDDGEQTDRAARPNRSIHTAFGVPKRAVRRYPHSGGPPKYGGGADRGQVRGSVLYLSGIPAHCELRMIISYVRGGKLERIEFIPQIPGVSTRSAKVSFVNPDDAERFLNLTGGFLYLTTLNSYVQVAWSKYAGQVDIRSVELANDPEVDASRVLNIRKISRQVSEEEVRNDIQTAFRRGQVHYAGIEAFSVNYDVGRSGRGKIWGVMVHLYCIPGALATLRFIESQAKYEGVEMSFGEDECAESLATSRILGDIAERATDRYIFKHKLRKCHMPVYEEAAELYYGRESDYNEDYSNFEIRFMEPGYY